MGGRNEAPAGTLAGNPDFSGRKKAPAGMLLGSPDFGGKMKPLWACWREIQTFLDGKSSLGATLTDVFLAVGHKILELWGWEPTIFGIDIKTGNFEPKSIFWEWF